MSQTRVRPPFARHAASLLLWRDGPDGTEVLMGVRGAGHRFMPNRLVFPGGAVDPADRTSLAATEPDKATLAMIGRKAQPRLARAVVAAAAREVEEETGVSFGHPPALHTIRYLCRAVTPPALPMRFNARFLVAPAAATTGEPADSRELHSVRFYPVEQALGLGLMSVTHDVLLRLQTFLALSDAERDARTELFAYERHKWKSE
jgi:8-oxo-dGTP pyrophosphatase MutT (NUDIX family)